MNGLFKAAAAVVALAGVGYVGYRCGNKLMGEICKSNTHRIAGRYGDPALEETYTKPAPAAAGAQSGDVK